MITMNVNQKISTLFFVLCILLTSCNTHRVKTYGNVIKWNLQSEPKTIDPQLNAAVDGSDVINHLHEGLMREVNGKITNGIAENHEVSEDGLTYTFYLRESKWSDGQPLTAHDFEYAWKRCLAPETASEFAFIMYPIKYGEAYLNGEMPRDSVGVKAIDDYTLEVTLRAPTDYFLSLTTIATFQPTREDIVAKGADGAWAKNPDVSVTNGPFKLVDYRLGEKMVFQKNEHYWRAEDTNIDFIEVYMITEASTSLTAYEAGDMDVIDDVPTQEILRLINEDPSFEILPLLGVYYYTFNLNIEALKDVRVRKALAYSINRKKITGIVLKGGQMPAFSMVPYGLRDAAGNDFSKTSGKHLLEDGNQNFEDAKKLLSEAGYPDGKDFPALTLEYNTSEAHKSVAETIQEMWKSNLGIDVNLQNSEWAVFQDKRVQNDFEIARGGWISDFADPITFLDILISGSTQNYGKWDSKMYDALIDSSKYATGQERFNYLYKAQEVMMQDMPVIPIYYYNDAVMVKRHIKNWEKTTMGNFYFGNAYFANE